MGELKALISDDKGNPSSMRVALFFVLFVVLANWTLANMGVFKWHPLSLGDMGALASVFLAKSLQKKNEEGP